MLKKLLLTIFVIFLLNFNIVDFSHSEEQKDHITAFLLSFAIPGFGQYYAGSPGNAKIFIAAELAIWGGYYYNTLIKKTYREDYLSFAALHAGVNSSGIGTSYINAIGSYNSSFDYNQHQLQIDKSPGLYTGTLMWEWDTLKNRSHFKNLRERELDYENYAKYCIAGIILNHFLSGLNASKLIQNSKKANAALTVNVIDEGLGVNYSRNF